MKKIFYIILLFLFLIILIIFSPSLRILDRFLISNEEVNLWQKNAVEGNITATSKLIIFYENDSPQHDKWLQLHKKQRETRKQEYLNLKKESDEGNKTATLKIEKLKSIGYF